MREILEDSPFQNVTFQHYWKDGNFINNPIRYDLGMVQRTPDNDPRCWSVRPKGRLKNFIHRLKNGFRMSEEDKACLEGHPLYVTSLVIDCTK